LKGPDFATLKPKEIRNEHRKCTDST